MYKILIGCLYLYIYFISTVYITYFLLIFFVSFFFVYFFFFFQAEDGIRDKLVTGVQTCALPIFGSDRNRCCVLYLCKLRNLWLHHSSRFASLLKAARKPASFGIPASPQPNVRSEERRVGKSVDLGGRRIIKKKKRKEEKENR